MPEVEPNDTKAAATAATLAPGDTLSGMTTGASTTVAGPGSADYFLITAAAAPRAIYRYTMTLTTTGATGHTATLRGLSQTAAGVINAGTDSSAQTSFTSAPTRVNAWYGFGYQEQVYYRVAGAAATTGGYSAELTRSTVTPVELGTNLDPAEYSIRATMTGATSDPEIWVYNRDTLQPIDGFNNDDTLAGTPGGSGLFSTLTRTFAAGRYLLAISDYNLQNDQPSPADENGRAEVVMDFPNILTSGDREGAWTANIEWRTGGPTGAAVASASVSQADNFEVIFIAFDVGAVTPVCPADIGATGGVPGNDGVLDNNDFVVFIDYFFQQNPLADRGSTGGVPGADGAWDNNDFVVFIDQFFAGCV
ncbi:MAG TPA: GC-type dockerin domain-anchored protein [Phycisphaerales bacterium]|nr:GC-type dockerin domain-anchored protein [Phycisphaerales bacterium]